MNRPVARILWLVLGFLLLAGCSGNTVGTENSAEISGKEVSAVNEVTEIASAGQSGPIQEGEYWPTNGWRISTPEAHGMDSEKLAAFVEAAVNSGRFKSFVIVRDGYIVAEKYFGIKPDKRQRVYSVTKSVVSTLFGIAMEEGKIESVDTKVLDCFPDTTFDHVDENKQNMTLENLLTMTSGLDWPYAGMQDFSEWEDDPTKYVLDMEMAAAPGHNFLYHNGTVEVLGEYISQAVGEDISDYAAEKLFTPMGITGQFWTPTLNGQRDAACSGLCLTARDMAKYGYLYLHNGEWDGQQLVPAAWVQTSTNIHVGEEGNFDQYISGYGYLWWVDANGCYSARGYQGQFVFVFPNLDMIVVVQAGFTGETDGVNNELIPEVLMNEYILPAVVSDEALPENPEAYERLQALCATES